MAEDRPKAIVSLIPDSSKVFDLSDRELVVGVAVVEPNEHTRELCKAELTRRQTAAVRTFNLSSTILSVAMILLVVVVSWAELGALLGRLFGD